MEQLRRYELLEVIGKGTTGSVHKVARKADGTLFVLKQVALSGFSEAQRDEVQAFGQNKTGAEAAIHSMAPLDARH